VNAQTISEKILSAHCGHPVRAGEIGVCRVDCVIATGLEPMAIDHFEQMGGQSLFDPSRVFFSLDHYAPPDPPRTTAFHRRIRTFAASHGGR
jgi:3-isopropylmalate/(R)-2-methylmalate dehydratase large subunit